VISSARVGADGGKKNRQSFLYSFKAVIFKTSYSCHLHVHLTTDVLRHRTSAVCCYAYWRTPVRVNGKIPSEPDGISSLFLFASGRLIPDPSELSCDVGGQPVVLNHVDGLLC